VEDIEDIYPEESEESVDDFQKAASEDVRKLFRDNSERVFYSRQVEVMLEKKYFHWVTNRVLRTLAEQRVINREVRTFAWGGSITLYWNSSYRFYRREASKVIDIVESYSKDSITSAIGQHCELLVVEGFAKIQFVNLGRSVNQYKGIKWNESNHNLDMIVERDGIGYGIEVKNTLGYIDKDEFDIKIAMCLFLGLRPVFVARMLPADWLNELVVRGGFGLLMKYLLYPALLYDLAVRMKEELGLPVECPKSLYEGTMKRFEKWHIKHVN
jgi:hypothetical protein